MPIIFDIGKIDFESQIILALFDTSPINQPSKFNHFLMVCWFLTNIFPILYPPPKNLTNRTTISCTLVKNIQLNKGFAISMIRLLLIISKPHFSLLQLLLSFFLQKKTSFVFCLDATWLSTALFGSLRALLKDLHFTYSTIQFSLRSGTFVMFEAVWLELGSVY